jgi:hypothetical protein
MKQTAVEWFSNQSYELFEQYSERRFDRITLNKFMLEATDKAKAMEKEQIIDAHIEGQRLFDDYQHTQWTTDQSEQYYNETYTHSINTVK